MAEIKGLGILDLIEGEQENTKIKIKLKDKFSWFSSSEFKALREFFKPDFENDDKTDLLADLKKNTPLALQMIHRGKTIRIFRRVIQYKDRKS